MSARRKGFTLVEVLLAAAISGTLMFGLFGALDLSAKYRTAGREQAQCDRIAIAAARYFETLVREAPLHVIGEADSAFAPEVTHRALRRKNAEEPESDVVLIAGNATTLVVGAREVRPASSQLRAGRLARVVSTESLRTELLPAQWGGRLVADGLTAEDNLGRLSTALLREVEPASGLSRSRWEVEQVNELSEDVVRLSFRYFDGVNWAMSWAGEDDEPRRLQAVEVSFVARGGSVERPVRLVIPTLARGGRR